MLNGSSIGSYSVLLVILTVCSSLVVSTIVSGYYKLSSGVVSIAATGS